MYAAHSFRALCAKKVDPLVLSLSFSLFSFPESRMQDPDVSEKLKHRAVSYIIQRAPRAHTCIETCNLDTVSHHAARATLIQS